MRAKMLCVRTDLLGKKNEEFVRFFLQKFNGFFIKNWEISSFFLPFWQVILVKKIKKVLHAEKK